MNLDQFIDLTDLYSPVVNRQTWVRCKITLAAYAYEFDNRSVISDQIFDDLCKEVDLSVETRRPDLDKWYKENFQPDTGMWIHKHPELDRVAGLYQQVYGDKKNVRRAR